MSHYCSLTLSTVALAGVIAFAAASHAAEAPKPPAAAASTGWTITSKTSALDDSLTFTAVLKASNTVADSVGEEHVPILLFRCRDHSGLDVMIGWPAFIGAHDVQGAYKVDESPVVRGPWDAATDGLGMFFAGDRKVFVTELSTAHRLVVQTTRYQSGPVEAVFDLGDVSKPAEQALKACT